MSVLLLQTSDVGRAEDPYQSHFSSLECIDKGKLGNLNKLCFCEHMLGFGELRCEHMLGSDKLRCERMFGFGDHSALHKQQIII